uniref:Uncharacterized protein n=1 Tax=Solanum tuberosum TaxID=4113 RepID=M1AUB3_SOLTU
MWWEPRGGTCAIWYDNWSNLGPLHIHDSDVHTCYPMKDTAEFLKEGGWDYTLMRDFVPEYVVDHVHANLYHAYLSNKVDKTWWTEISNGKLLCPPNQSYSDQASKNFEITEFLGNRGVKSLIRSSKISLGTFEEKERQS